jgi:hypothetical protein
LQFDAAAIVIWRSLLPVIADGAIGCRGFAALEMQVSDRNRAFPESNMLD